MRIRALPVSGSCSCYLLFEEMPLTGKEIVLTEKGWHKGKPSGAETPAQPMEPTPLPFDWDLFDDMSWSWNFDIPLVPDN